MLITLEWGGGVDELYVDGRRWRVEGGQQSREVWSECERDYVIKLNSTCGEQDKINRNDFLSFLSLEIITVYFISFWSETFYMRLFALYLHLH